MKSFFASLAAAAVFATSALAQLTINTPSNPVVCQPLLISWSGGTGPYFLSILPGNQPTAAALQNFPTQTGTSLTWIVNIAVGTSIGLHIVDSTGLSQDSAPFSVLPGSDTSCVGKNPTSSGGASSTGSGTGASTGASTTSAVVATSSTPATRATTSTAPSVTTATGTTSKPATSGTTSAPATTSSKASGAISQNAQFGAAGVVGAAIIALLA